MNKLPTFDIQSTYDAMHRTFPGYKTSPLIGLTGNFRDGDCTLAEGYYQSVLQAGGTPIIIPPIDDTDALSTVLDTLDGILLTGGSDINPLYFGEDPIKSLHGINPRRDKQELLLVKLAADRQIPILGICRGIQTLNAALGGTLYQDIHSQMDNTCIKHDQDLDRSYASHIVEIVPDSLLYHIFGTDTLAVNSFHHQAVKTVPEGMIVSAQSADGVERKRQNRQRDGHQHRQRV